MLRRLVKRGFTARIFTWGGNFTNLGHVDFDEANFPKLLEFSDDAPPERPLKAVSGYSESLLVYPEGQMLTFGVGKLVDKQHYLPVLYDQPQLEETNEPLEVLDSDCDRSHIVMLTKGGAVWDTRDLKRPIPVLLGDPARLIAAGDGISLAVVDDEGEDVVYVWGRPTRGNGAIFCAQVEHARYLEPLYPVNKMISKLGSRIKKVRIVDSSAVLLLENGQLIAWGNNQNGNLGVPRCELSLVDDHVYIPELPLKLGGIDEKAVDFELSDNMLIVLTDFGNAYYAGLNNVLKLTRIPFFEEQRVHAVGCTHNKFFLIDQTGKLFSNRPFCENGRLKYYGAQQLFELDASYFENRPVASVGGKYDNVIALCN